MTSETALPIVYVRGFAGGTSGIDGTVGDPFYGFNAGGTHVRVNGGGQPQYYQFEGPLVRLVEDEGYRVVAHGSQQAYLQSAPDKSQPLNSIWIYRFYDQASDNLGHPASPFSLPVAAQGLLDFIQLVRRRTGAAKVWLVAHSMGGLICRSMIQQACPDRNLDARQIVDKLFTYATPHNGIDFSIAGLAIPVPQIAPFGAQIFNRDDMYGYLTPAETLRKTPQRPATWDAHSIKDFFDPKRVFCLIGTDPADYGIVSQVVGPKSDGLVQIDNAYVQDADRSFVHRSHSGNYGEVNSEEGYQNLRRFLFGTRRVTAELVSYQLPAATDQDTVDVWQAEVRLSIRGLPVLISGQTAADYNPINLGTVAGAHARPGAPAPDDVAIAGGNPAGGGTGAVTFLACAYLLDPQRAAAMQQDNLQAGPVSPRCRYSLQLDVLHLTEKHGLFAWQQHLETLPEWSDALILDVGPEPGDGGEHLWAAWQSANPDVTSTIDPIASKPLQPASAADGTLTFDIQLPKTGPDLLGPNAAIKLTVQDWS